MVDAMTPGRARPARVCDGKQLARRTSTDLVRAAAIALVGVFLGAGCGSATGQAASTSRTTGLQPAGFSSTRLAGSDPSGIDGQTVAIVCGGPSSEHGCPRRPVVATIDVLRMPSEQHIATVRTDKHGHFQRDLPPATYELRAHASSQLIWTRDVTARVRPHQIKRTTITFVPRHPLPVTPGSASG
jgi:hypothetical protein